MKPRRWSTGYCGQSPERPSTTWRTRRTSTSSLRRARDRPVASLRPALAMLGHPESASRHPHLYNTKLHVKDAADLPARSGRTEGVSPAAPVLLAPSRSRTAIPSSLRGSQDARLGQGFIAVERATIEKIDGATGRISWALDLRRHPTGLPRARGMHLWQLPRRGPMPSACRPIPVHRALSIRRGRISSPNIRRCPIAQFRCPMSASTCDASVERVAKHFRSSSSGQAGRLRMLRRGTPLEQWLPAAAGDVRRDQSGGRGRRGIKDAHWVWVYAPITVQGHLKALVHRTGRQGRAPGMPFHFAAGSRARPTSNIPPAPILSCWARSSCWLTTYATSR